MTSKISRYARLRELISELTQEAAAGLPDRKARAALREARQASDEVDRLVQQLDPITRPQHVFYPSDPRITGLFVAMALVAQETLALGSLKVFYGSGVYALYYRGDFSPYGPICRTEHPIYIGKADPKDPQAGLPWDQGDKLFGRLKEHRSSIAKAKNLRVDDFRCRHLVVQSGFQNAAEGYLRSFFNPLWNGLGIGKHGDFASTRQNKKSVWDTLHPGRTWAGPSPEGKSEAEILSNVEAHFIAHHIYRSVNEIVDQFYLQLKQK
ncbi:MAG TPA: Eco29kI family restriction endonuclease [Terriglobia bacterium]|nr:Eco29kI family restriction endonuclease [Terriglobia bacterium]